MSDEYFDAETPKHPSEKHEGLHEDDPELERDYRILARMLLDFYYEQQQLKSFPQDGIDKQS